MDVYEDINLVDYVINPIKRSHGISFVINVQFSRRLRRLSILGFLGDLDYASLSKWRYDMCIVVTLSPFRLKAKSILEAVVKEVTLT